MSRWPEWQAVSSIMWSTAQRTLAGWSPSDPPCLPFGAAVRETELKTSSERRHWSR